MSFKSLEATVVGLCNQVLGEDVTYTHADTTTDEIKGVFSEAFVEVNGVASLKPTLRIKLDDLSSDPSKGDSVLISSVSYRVVEPPQADGFGGATLILHRM